MNWQFYGLVELKKVQPPSFDYDAAIEEGWLMQMEKLFETMGGTEK